MKKQAALLSAIVVLAGCATTTPPATPPQLPEPLAAMVMSVDKATQPSVLSAVVTLVNAGLIVHYTWEPATTGTTAVAYEVQVGQVVPDNNIYVLKAQKDLITVVTRGIDDLDRIGPWSEMSDTLFTGEVVK